MDTKDMFFEALCDALHNMRKAEMRSRRIEDWNEEDEHDADNYIKSIMSCVDRICEHF